MMADRSEKSLISSPKFELMPFDSIEEQTAHVPEDAPIAITASPTLGLADTITWTETLAEQGYEIVPHVAARYVRDRNHLDEIATRLTDVGVSSIFVPGGDREDPVGDFESAYQLLVALEELGHEFEEVGITGYPEGHKFLDEEELADAMAKKAPYATYITTQICYDPEEIIEWIDRVRTEREIDLPVEIGIPGVMKYQKLIGISRKVGVGDSLRFLQSTTGILGFIRQFIGSRGKYEPDELIDGLDPYIDDPHYNIKGLHIYTFNQVPDTEAWRRSRLDA